MKQRNVYPFAAISGQERMKTGIILTVINPSLSGILSGRKGNREINGGKGPCRNPALLEVIRDCPFNLSPDESGDCCTECRNGSCRDRRLTGNPWRR